MVEEELQTDNWIPSTDAERNEVLVQLERMLESPLFRNSKRYPNMLRHLVEQTLAGNEALLKERLLGMAVFHRPPDYDTNQDTVVRLTAGEIRKRIAQYYYQPEHSGQLRIDLRAGSYVPVFRRPVFRRPGLPTAVSQIPHRKRSSEEHARGLVADMSTSAGRNDSPFTVESESLGLPLTLQDTVAQTPALEPIETFNARNHLTRKPARFTLSRLTRRLAAAAALIVASSGAFLWWHASLTAHTPESQLWAPILQEPGPVLLVIADLSASLNHAQGVSASQTAELFDLLRMGELVNYRDSIAQSGIAAFLSQHNKPYTLELSTQASYPDLQRGASVLIGGLDNVWTMRLTEPLRYHFVRRGATYAFAIEDRQHPEMGGWNVNLSQPADRDTEDYAIVARIFDQTTGRPVLVVAGLGANGTAAAARFLLDPARTAELAAQAPHNWQRLNMEAVLRTQILDNHAGPSHLVAYTFW